MANKLLLIEDVEGLGRKGDIVGAKPGYARNFLLPQGLAIIADKQAIRLQVRLQQERQQRAAVDKTESEQLAARIQDQTLVAIVKIDHEGHMYGSVSSTDIVHLLQQHDAALVFERRNVLLPHPIKQVGTTTVKLRFKEGVIASFNLKVTPEDQEAAPATAEA
ncbi:MAG: 50S ribosomal protein L9 [Parachlamydiaceae bacterium]|nr:50S ribosomal protein L9 [Parachlamydiaceae bacterium]